MIERKIIKKEQDRDKGDDDDSENLPPPSLSSRNHHEFHHRHADEHSGNHNCQGHKRCRAGGEPDDGEEDPGDDYIDHNVPRDKKDRKYKRIRRSMSDPRNNRLHNDNRSKSYARYSAIKVALPMVPGKRLIFYSC